VQNFFGNRIRHFQVDVLSVLFGFFILYFNVSVIDVVQAIGPQTIFIRFAIRLFTRNNRISVIYVYTQSRINIFYFLSSSNGLNSTPSLVNIFNVSQFVGKLYIFGFFFSLIELIRKRVDEMSSTSQCLFRPQNEIREKNQKKSSALSELGNRSFSFSKLLTITLSCGYTSSYRLIRARRAESPTASRDIYTNTIIKRP